MPLRPPGVIAAAVPLLVAAAVGCQPSQADMSHHLAVRMSRIDFSGLAPAAPLGAGVDASAALPRSWQLRPATGNGMFTHRQWRSPSGATAVGVVHVHLPLPMSAQTLVWLAKARYSSAADKASADPKANPKSDPKNKVPGGGGRLLGEWTDAVGREWIEAENDKFHVRGYAVTCGFDAWLAYVGHKRAGVPDPMEQELATRSLESIVPAPLAAGR